MNLLHLRYLGNDNEWDLVPELTVKLERWPEAQDCYQLWCYLHKTLVDSVHFPHFLGQVWTFPLLPVLNPHPYYILIFLERGEV